jgi:protein-serine/threonine kinase
MTMMLQHTQSNPFSAVPASPTFAEDLSRFPSESLHSFSFAHQSEEFIHSRQNVLKRSLEFMKDRTGWSEKSNVAIASAQARISGDVEAQNMLDLLARAQLVGAGNLPNPDPSIIQGPLSGPAEMSGENVFEKQFIPRTASPDSYQDPSVSPTTASDRPEAALADPADRSLPNLKPKPKPLSTSLDVADSPDSSRTPTNESGTTQQTSPPSSRRPSVLKRTMTDTAPISMQQKLMDTLAQPFVAGQLGYQDAALSPTSSQPFSSTVSFPSALGPAAHSHSTRWVPAAQAIFTTEAKPPWTILAANDLACLVFGVTIAEIRKMGILEVVQEERRGWLEKKLLREDGDETSTSADSKKKQKPPAVVASSLLGGRGGGITAKLLSKPNSRSQPKIQQGRRAQTVHSGDSTPRKSDGSGNHNSNKSRGVLLCGDVVPIQKRNGATGSASLWVKEKRVGLIWVLEEIHEDVATVDLADEGIVTAVGGAVAPIWGEDAVEIGTDVGKLIPRIPRQGIDPRFGELDFAQITKRKFFTCRNSNDINIPATVEQVRGKPVLRVSSFPHIAGIIVVSPDTLRIKSSNSVFCSALFGHENPDGLPLVNLVPGFDKLLRILTDEEGIMLHDGIVIPEHSFRRASAFQALREGRPDAATCFLRPDGLPAKHRDGSELKIDVQMRVVKSEKQATIPEESVMESSDDDSAAALTDDNIPVAQSEMVYALWVTYSRHLHATKSKPIAASPSLSDPNTPLRQPSPGQTPAHTPKEIASDSDEPKKEPSTASMLTRQLRDVALSAAARLTGATRSGETQIQRQPSQPVEAASRKKIDDFAILEEMGQGAYGQVKLASYKGTARKVVLKYVTKRRILVDTWTRDRRLGTVPLEIHVLNYLRKEEFRHPNIVEMEDFFEDDINYYIEMKPHGLPGMDLFDYIELRTNMEEGECRSIFAQVAQAIHHLHTKAAVVHRDIKDENVILDGDGNIKLIDFGSAAYIKSGPFDVFVGTIGKSGRLRGAVHCAYANLAGLEDYAAPEVLAGKPYGGKEQDVWALGILLYTIIYKENPFYNIDEIMDGDLRVPWTLGDDSIDLIRGMLDRDVKQRYDINQVVNHPWCKQV